MGMAQRSILTLLRMVGSPFETMAKAHEGIEDFSSGLEYAILGCGFPGICLWLSIWMSACRFFESLVNCDCPEDTQA